MNKINLNKLKLQTPNKIDENIEKLAQLFPNIISETKDKNTVKKAVDFDLLRQILSDNIVEGDDERYRLDWPGKKASLLKANRPIKKTLRPCIEESKDFENTQNLYIEGDNFEVLKLLQESYLNKIKMIYIDPPYNTGKDFVYKDNFKESQEAYEDKISLKDEEENKLFKNTDSNGRFHSDWLSMMYERLLISRDLLKDDGAIFISIDDNEVDNLKKICDEVFGENNFINLIVIKMSEMKGAKLSHVDKKFPKIKEYLLIYSKDKELFRFDPIKKIKQEEELKKYSKYYNKEIINFDDDVSSWEFRSISYDYKEKIRKSERLIYLVSPDKEQTFDIPLNKFFATINSYNNINYFYNQDGNIKKVLFFKENMSTYLGDLWLDISTININKENYSIPTYSNGQKPIDLIKNIIESFLDDDDIILDFFSGSGTTADVIFRTNNLEKSNKFILVQIPEKISILPGMNTETKKSVNKMIDFLNLIGKPLYLTEIGKERIRRAGEKILEDNKDKENIKNLDIGFRVLKTDSSNFKDVYYHPNDLGQQDLFNLESNIKEDRSELDLLFQVMLDLGIELDLKIQSETYDNSTLYILENSELVACFSDNISLKTIEKIKSKNPYKIVLKEGCFANDTEKINAIQDLSQNSSVSVI